MRSHGERLGSWKEIAAYLGRSARTVRRWEQHEGLPVHRHMHRSQASIFALREELEAWRQARSSIPTPSAAAPTSIAVLPFENLSAAARDQYFAAGLTEEVTTTLSKLSSLRVTSGSSARAAKVRGGSAATLARLLKVRYLLQGSVRRDGRRVRIAAQLIDAAEDVHLWGDSFEGPPDDAFAIQQRLACLIAEALRLRLTPREAQQLGEQPITDVGAYECYLRARQESWRWHPDSLNRAVRLLQQALEIGGDNARVYAALGIAHLQYREAGVDLSERPLARAQRCARQVFALQPQAAVGAQLMGWIAYSRGAIQQAVRDLKVALAAEPHNPDTLLLLSNCYLISGKVPAARPLLERLASVDPLTPLSLCMPAFADILDGKPERAIKPYRAMLERDPANPVARLFLVWVLVLNDRMRQAATIVKTCPADAHDTLAAQLMRFLAAAPRSEPGALRAMLTPQVESAAAASDVFPRILAQGFALAGDRRAALRWLTIAVERGFINWPFLAHHDPCLRQLRRERGFRELLDRVRGRWRAFEV